MEWKKRTVKECMGGNRKEDLKHLMKFYLCAMNNKNKKTLKCNLSNKLVM